MHVRLLTWRLARRLAVALLVTGCAPRAPVPAVTLHYMVGEAYQSGGVWQYPQEQFQLDTTGLAEMLDHRGPTVEGEAWEGMAAAHGTLQLPAIIRVTNLETGLQVQLRVIDRGPPGVHRLLGVTRQAGTLLGMTGPTQIRLEVMDEPSQALRERMLGGPVRAFSAPRQTVLAESPPPPGGKVSPRPLLQAEPASAVVASGPTLPESSGRVMVSPGTLWLDAGHFTGGGAAETQARRLAAVEGRVERVGDGRSQSFRVRAGPFSSVTQADSALDQALQAGVTDARIVVE